jgi:tetratricopeptide (TPR) repeat protein
MLPFCDEIVVGVDNKTTDKTKEIAEKYADDVFLFEWQNDFSAARNRLSRRIKTDWVFWLDGHEYVETPPNVDFLRKTDCDAIMCQNRLDNGSVVRFPRLHRSNLSYKDQVHNNLVAKKICTTEKIQIVHNRAGGQSKESVEEREKQRNEMVVGIMGKRLKKDRKDTRASFHLGLHYHARREYRKAAKCYKLYLRYSKNVGERWYIRFNLIILRLALNQLVRAEYNCHLLEKESPGRWETNHMYGLVLFRRKKYAEAIPYFVRSFDNRKQEADYKPIVRNTAVDWNLIGECYYNLDLISESQMSFARAGDLEKDEIAKDLYKKRANLMTKILQSSK